MLVFIALLLVSCNFLSVSARSLSCSPSNFTCPGSVVSCECQGAKLQLFWRVTTTSAGTELLDERYVPSSAVGVPVSPRDGYTVVLCDVDTSTIPNILTSRLNFTFTEDVSVTCQDNNGMDTVTLQTAGPPSPPVNLQYTLNTTAADSVTVRLDWDPPLDDGGVAITHYQISVNMSEPVITTDTVATFTLNSTGEHLVQVRAVNCAGVSDDTSIVVTTTGESTISSTLITAPVTSTTTEVNFTALNTIATMDTSSDVLLALNTAAVVGVAISLLVVIAVVYTCGLLTGLLVQRKKRGKSSPTSASGDLVPMYEEVVLPTQTSISLKENVSYGLFN